MSRPSPFAARVASRWRSSRWWGSWWSRRSSSRGPAPIRTQLDRVSPSPLPAAVTAPLPTSSPGGPAETPAALVAASPAPLAPGQVDCGSSGWELVTLGSFLRWTVRTLTAITPVEAGGPGDPSIPVLWLGESDVAGVGACTPAARAGAPSPASRIVAAWQRSGGGATTATFGRVALSDLDVPPLGGPAGGPAAPPSTAPTSVVELAAHSRPHSADAGRPGGTSCSWRHSAQARTAGSLSTSVPRRGRTAPVGRRASQHSQESGAPSGGSVTPLPAARRRCRDGASTTRRTPGGRPARCQVTVRDGMTRFLTTRRQPARVHMPGFHGRCQEP